MTHVAGHGCPECKVVINGGRIAGNALVLADVVDKMMQRGNTLPTGVAKKMIAFLNEAEDLVDKATNALVRAGYDGPLNKALADEEES